MHDNCGFLVYLSPAVPGVQWREVHEEDSDRRSLYLAGQGGHEEESGQLAQAIGQLHSDQPLRTTPGQ